jgi:hypothetical protein
MSTRGEESVADTLGVPRDDLSVFVTHLCLVVGIVFFRWSIDELILVYLIEIGVTILLFATAALFAAQPIDDGEADKWGEAPNPIELPLLPPLYRRNVRPVARQLLNGAGFFCFFALIAVSVFELSLSSLSSLSVVLTIAAVCGSQAAQVWRQFLGDGSYRDRSPADALKLALRPIGRLLVIALYVIAPITVVIGFTTILVLDVESVSAVPYGDTLILLAYVVPIGAASVWLRNDRFEMGLSY